MTRGEQRLLEELRRVRTEVEILRAVHIRSSRYGWLKPFIHDLETNPHTQYKVHRWGVIWWIVNFPLIAVFFFALPSEWLKWGVFITLQYSIYANFATDYGAMSAAMAAYDDKALPEIPLEVHPPVPLPPEDSHE
jgi:hypothetical protein